MGKREYRGFAGDDTLTQHDVLGRTFFPDRIGLGGGSIDPARHGPVGRPRARSCDVPRRRWRTRRWSSTCTGRCDQTYQVVQRGGSSPPRLPGAGRRSGGSPRLPATTCRGPGSGPDPCATSA
nr:FAD-dependent oxidoreductase [Thermasporomyces composti]